MCQHLVRLAQLEHPGQLTIHSDRGSPMVSKTLGELMVDLEITRSLSRPQVSDDNRFFDWYHHVHRHSGIAWMTPADVHHDRACAVRDRRVAALDAAYQRHPERFVRKRPEPDVLPPAVWINRPVLAASTQ